MNALQAVQILKTGKSVVSGKLLHKMCHGEIIMTILCDTSCAGTLQSLLTPVAFVDQNKEIKFYEQKQ